MSEQEIYTELVSARYEVTEGLRKLKSAAIRLDFSDSSIADDVSDCLADAEMKNLKCIVDED